MAQMLFADPRFRPPLEQPRVAKPFLIEVPFEGRYDFINHPLLKERELTIHQLAAMCDEDCEDPNLVIQISGIPFEFDKRYLGRIWPNLFKINPPILVAASDVFHLIYPAKAVVVLVGASLPVR